METISLQELLEKHINSVTITDIDTITPVDSLREREMSWSRVLPPQLIRRIDKGFARSHTVHPDTGRVLYAVCRAMKPSHVFETGTYWGYSTAYLAAAVRDNHVGKIHTFDLYERAGKHIPQSLLPHIDLYRGKPSTEMMPQVLQKVTPTLFFQDSLHDYDGVKSELEIVDPHLKANAIILFHDFVTAEVRRAAIETLHNYSLYVLESQDPAQIGVAVKGE